MNNISTKLIINDKYIRANLNFLILTMFLLVLLTTTQSVLAESSAKKLNVFACEPEWQSLINEIAGDKVEVFTATTGLQDPHQIQARPSLISQMRDANLLVCSGADLEVGWLPILLRRANNSALQVGQIGHFLAADHVRLLGAPQNIDRSQGDVHAAGNPHVHTSPKNIKMIAKALIQRLQIIDQKNADYYQQQGEDFLKRWDVAMGRWEEQVEKIKGTKIVVQHASWDYFNQFAKLEQIAIIEEKPGIPATSGHLVKLLTDLKQQPAQLIIYAAYQNGKASDWLSEKSGLPVIALPFTIGGNEQATDLFSLFDNSLALISATVDLEPQQETAKP